eukprot:TRINITY_DN6189_c0_g1_i4.p1 TRINITY_DN6189_c0_g1~~TRINITY_DN6189_c0_g1_i4.p1  ORF type:complete len:424 (+),score=141.94 TRINITY_DN6189_c0_g1_i4:498-1769(+)
MTRLRSEIRAALVSPERAEAEDRSSAAPTGRRSREQRKSMRSMPATEARPEGDEQRTIIIKEEIMKVLAEELRNKELERAEDERRRREEERRTAEELGQAMYEKYQAILRQTSISPRRVRSELHTSIVTEIEKYVQVSPQRQLAGGIVVRAQDKSESKEQTSNETRRSQYVESKDQRTSETRRSQYVESNQQRSSETRRSQFVEDTASQLRKEIKEIPPAPPVDVYHVRSSTQTKLNTNQNYDRLEQSQEMTRTPASQFEPFRKTSIDSGSRTQKNDQSREERSILETLSKQGTGQFTQLPPLQPEIKEKVDERISQKDFQRWEEDLKNIQQSIGTRAGEVQKTVIEEGVQTTTEERNYTEEDLWMQFQAFLRTLNDDELYHSSLKFVTLFYFFEQKLEHRVSVQHTEPVSYTHLTLPTIYSV